MINKGGLVAFPTETVYGLGADAFNATAVSNIFLAKGRPTYDPIIVHIAEAADLDLVAKDIPPVARTLAAQFWPGALTLILPKSDAIPNIVTANGPTVAVRCPAHPLAQALIAAAGTPIAAPSANQFSHTSPTTAQHVWDDLAGKIEMILDGGATTIGVESTVLDITGEVPTVLRPGGVTVEALKACTERRPGSQAEVAVLPTLQIRTSSSNPAAPPAPGMLDRHYAPQVEMWLFTGTDEEIRQAMLEIGETEGENGRSISLLLAEEDVPHFAHTSHKIGIVGSLDNLEQVAQNLFHTMRTLDAPNIDLILARDFPPHGLGHAIRDRLRRAAKRIINCEQ